MNRRCMKSALDPTHEVIIFMDKHENPNSEQLSEDRAIVIWCLSV